MDIQTAKQIRLEEYLHSLGYSPVKRQASIFGTITVQGRNRSLVQGEHRAEPMV